MEVKNVSMYDQPIAGVSMFGGDPVEIIGEQEAKLDDGRVVEQYLYNIVGYTPQNGQPFVSLKANIVTR